jgi:hypothetical protein
MVIDAHVKKIKNRGKGSRVLSSRPAQAVYAYTVSKKQREGKGGQRGEREWKTRKEKLKTEMKS